MMTAKLGKQSDHNPRILLIDNNDSFTYNLVQALEEEGSNEIAVIPYNKVNSKIIGDFEKIMISPGPGLPADFPNLMEWILEFAAKKSFFGICLGHEAIAVAFGGELQHLGTVYHGITKRTKIVDKSHPVFYNIQDEFLAGLYHSWAINREKLPEMLKITAESDDGIIMSLAHKNLDITGVQFHPESIMTPEGKKMIRNWIQSIH